MTRKPLTKIELEELIDVARGLKPADMVLRGAKTLDVFSGTWISGDVAIWRGRVAGVGEKYEGKKTVQLKGRYLVPGFIDSHVHIESTMMTPGQYERVVLPRGTTAAIVDPHEIANVLGETGIRYFLECASKATMNIYVQLSSCVPATTAFETAGAHLQAANLLKFKNHPNALGLAEMMNFPGLLNKDPEVIEKLAAFQDRMIDGHCPGLTGKDLNAYVAAGVMSCHETITLSEAKEKIERGMQVLLREGSVAKNLKDLVPVLTPFSSPCVSLCTDDRNPVDILDEGHIDYMARMAIEEGHKPETVLRAASWSSARAYGLTGKGAIAPGYDADIVVLKNLKKVLVEKVLKDGRWIDDESDIPEIKVPAPGRDSMRCKTPLLPDFRVSANSSGGKYRVIEVIPDQIITKSLQVSMKETAGEIAADTKRDILKIAVLERHGHDEPLALGLVKGFGFKTGAIGSSVGHDSHNAVTVGTNDSDMQACFKWLKEHGGGFVVIEDGEVRAGVPLPIAGLMTDEPLNEVYKGLKKLRTESKKIGGKLHEPFLQLAFLCLPVIPSLKITNKGLIDVDRFVRVPLAVETSTSPAN